MKRSIFLTMVCTIACFFTIHAQQTIYKSSKSKVEFVSEAPLEIIRATSEELKGVLDPAKRTFAFTIPVESFKGFNSPLQREHFNENYMEVKKFPLSKFQGKIIEQIDFAKEGEYSIRAKGSFEIHGIEQERIIKLKLKIAKGILTASGAFTVLLSEHNINVPKVVNQKIEEEIKITVFVEFGKSAK